MKTNKKNMHHALAYVVFMQTASYFDVKPECRSLLMERRLELCYKDTQMKQQFLMEQSCEKYLQSFIKDIPKEMWEMRSEVVFKHMDPCYGSGVYAVYFVTWKYVLCIAGRYDRNGRLELIHELHEFLIQ